MDAIEALSQLSLRLSRPHLHLLNPTNSSGRHQGSKKRQEKGRKNLKATSASTVGRLKLANASAPQLVMVRPRAKRTHSGSSSRSHGPLSPKLPNSPASPPPPYSKMAKLSTKSTPNLQETISPMLPPPHMPPPSSSIPLRRDQIEEIRRRRADRVTPSMYTFASDSTKLGEIPVRKWTSPFDYEEMGRRNKEVAMGTSHLQVQEQVQKRKRGFWGLFKRGNNPTPVAS
jgi:hypothetical protein